MDGVAISQIAKDPDIGANMLNRWRREQAKDGVRAFQGQGKARNEEMALLKHELACVK